ncbi:hypothetical protein [Agrobacterium larrymoorei]|uniref:hypothetical protein n=1 Tax=Agrobacterium larrymoorei TaxID=160699 RepID=UPI0030BD177E
MADERKTLDDLVQVTTLQATDLLLSKRPGGATSKATVKQLIDLADPAAVIHTADAKSTVVDNDEFGIADSADSFKLKKVKLSSLISSIFAATRKIANGGFVASSFKWWNDANTFYHSIAATPSANRTITIPDRNVDLTGVSSAAPFTSGQQTYANSSVVSVGHGLGGTPRRVRAKIVCVIAEGGYSIGDEVHLSTYWGYTGSAVRGCVVSANSTSVSFTVYAAILIAVRSGTTDVTLTPANWRVVLEAEL